MSVPKSYTAPHWFAVGRPQQARAAHPLVIVSASGRDPGLALTGDRAGLWSAAWQGPGLRVDPTSSLHLLALHLYRSGFLLPWPSWYTDWDTWTANLAAWQVPDTVPEEGRALAAALRATPRLRDAYDTVGAPDPRRPAFDAWALAHLGPLLRAGLRLEWGGSQ